MFSCTAAASGQLMLISGSSTLTATVAESLSLPVALRTVRETVFSPEALKLVEYDALLPEPPSLSLQA